MERLTFSIIRNDDEAQKIIIIGGKGTDNSMEVYRRLKKIEDILGDDYSLGRLREIVEADRDKRCVIFRKGYGIVPFYEKDDEWFVIRTVSGVVPESDLVMKHFIRKEGQA